MSKLEVKVKKTLESAVIPEYQSSGAAGLDLVAAKVKTVLGVTGPIDEIDTGLSFEIPENHVGLIFSRSSVTSKTTLMLGNAVAVIDADFRGSVKLQFRHTNPIVKKEYKVGDRVGQIIIMPIPAITLVEAQDLSDTERGEGGFGSTDG